MKKITNTNKKPTKSGIPREEIQRCLAEGLEAKKKESEILRKMMDRF